LNVVLKDLIERLKVATPLTEPQVREAVTELVDETVPAKIKADFLAALAGKGETVDEIASFALALREKATPTPLDPETRAGDILDVCGTGGDQLHTFNISTTVALLVAAAGLTVAKHGNRAITSKSGSADVLEALGLRIDLGPEQAARFLHDHQFAFFFAQKYHPAFKHIAPARKLCAARGQRTIFNFLGPLLNPARPTAQLVGVPHPRLCEPVARVLQKMGVRRGMVASGHIRGGGEAGPVYLDELSTLGESTLAEFYQDRGFHVSTFSPEPFALQAASLKDLEGGDREENAATVRAILSNRERGPKRDAVLLNAAAALFVGGRAKSLIEGWPVAEALLADGRALAKLDALVAASKEVV
jgi:anthranilate phosphoribosyltransferase